MSDELGEDVRLDLIRIRGFAIACCVYAKQSAKSVRTAMLAIDRARTPNEAKRAKDRLRRAVDRCTWLCDFAERMSVFAERCKEGLVDPSTRAEAAMAIEDLVG